MTIPTALGASPRVLVVGVGNVHCGDDGAGISVVRQLQRACATEETPFEIVTCAGDLTALVPRWADRDLVVVVDAMDASAAGLRAGEVRRWRVHDASLTPGDRDGLPWTVSGARHSTHAWGLADALALGAAIGMVPHEVVVYGIAGARWDVGSDLSPAVERAVRRVAGRLHDELQWQRRRRQPTRRPSQA